MKKILIIALLGALSALLWWQKSSSNIKKLPLVGVIQVIEHPALDQTRKGIFDELEANGFKDEVNFDWQYESAQNNAALATQISQKFIGEQAATIVTIGTNVAQACLQAIQQSGSKTPMVFASVTDPVLARLITSAKLPQPGVTGVSNYVPAKDQFAFFKKLLPHIKTLGVVYNPGEANSAVLLEEIQKTGKEFGIEIVEAVASRTSDVSTATQSLLSKVDAIVVNNDNTALASFDSVVASARLANIPVFVSDVDCVSKGALAALGADQYALGRQVGKMVIAILKNPEAANTQTMEYPAVIQEEINRKVANDLKIVLPSAE
jgi:putative ABC transport system substrate-binding protein